MNHGCLSSPIISSPYNTAAIPRPQTKMLWEIVAARPSKAACQTVPRTAMIKAAIIVFECPGSSPCRAPINNAAANSSTGAVCPANTRAEISISSPRERTLRQRHIGLLNGRLARASRSQGIGSLSSTSDLTQGRMNYPVKSGNDEASVAADRTKITVSTFYPIPLVWIFANEFASIRLPGSICSRGIRVRALRVRLDQAPAFQSQSARRNRTAEMWIVGDDDHRLRQGKKDIRQSFGGWLV
jgi:hypothetical protein